MFRPYDNHEQEKLVSPVKNLPSGPRKKLQDHWSTYFYEYVFTQIDEERFADLYDDGYSRPNKPVNELVSLEIIKHWRGLSDEELEVRYLFDLAVRNALGNETFGDNICQKTFTNFRRRLLDYEAETGQNLLRDVFEDHREHFIETFDLDGSTQRMDSTFLEANIKHLNRIDLVAKVVHNFLADLPEERLQNLPEELQAFADRDRDTLNLSYHLEPGEVEDELERFVAHAVRLVDRFGDEESYRTLQSFAHLERVLDEQCYRIPALEDDAATDVTEGSVDDETDDHPGWLPTKTRASSQDGEGSESADGSRSAEADAAEEADHPPSEDEDEPGAEPAAEVKDPADIASDSLQNPHDDEATYRRKNDERHYGYTMNLAETCDTDDLFRLITDVQVDTNTTADTEFLERTVGELADVTGLTDLLSDGGYQGEATERVSEDAGVTQHLSGIKGREPADPDGVSLADATFDGHELVACPEGHAPFEQAYTAETGRYWGRFDPSICGNCPFKDACFVDEKQDFFSYGVYDRDLEVARHRAKLADPEMEEFLNLRAGAESMVNEVTHKAGKRTTFTGKPPIEAAAIATAIGTNLNRAARALASAGAAESAAP